MCAVMFVCGGACLSAGGACLSAGGACLSAGGTNFTPSPYVLMCATMFTSLHHLMCLCERRCLSAWGTNLTPSPYEIINNKF